MFFVGLHLLGAEVPFVEFGLFMVRAVNTALVLGFLLALLAYQAFNRGMLSQDVLKQFGFKSPMATVMSAGAAEHLCAVWFGTAVSELVTLQANKVSVITRVMVHHVRVVAIALLVDATSHTSLRLFVPPALLA